MAQDLPPIGGYEPVQWKRNLPSRGFRPIVYFVGLVGLSAYGFYRASLGIHERRELRREQRWMEWYLAPLLQAEIERDSLRRTIAYNKRVNEVMKNAEGWENEYQGEGDEHKLKDIPRQFAFRDRFRGWWYGSNTVLTTFKHGQFWSFDETADEFVAKGSEKK